MADKLDPKSIAEALVELTKAKGTTQELIAMTKAYGKALGDDLTTMNKLSDSISEQVSLSERLLHQSNYVGKTLEQRLQLQKLSTNIEDAAYDIAQKQAQVRADLLLKQTMLNNGLTGEYAEQAKNYALAKELGYLSDHDYETKIASLKQQQHATEHLEKQLELTESLASWQLELNEELESYSMGWEKIKSKIKAIVTDPKVAKAVFLTSMVEKSHEVYENFEKLGQSGLTVGQRVDYMTKGFSLMSAMGLSDTKGVLDGMVETMGTMNSLTSDEVDHVGHLAKEMGVTGQEAFGLVEGFSKLPGETMETAAHAADYVKSLSKANGVAPGKITKEIAKNTELIALGGYKGAKAFTDAAMKAQKMGVELQTTSKVMNGLLNFENSLNKQMEASVLLGKEINLDKARQLALEGKSVEATEEVLKNIGGQAAFDKMNVLQKQALAEATGMTVEELNKAVDAQVEKNKYFGEEAGMWKNTLGYAMEYGGAVGGFLKENGMLLASSIQLLNTTGLLTKAAAGFQALWNGVLSIGSGLWGLITGQKAADTVTTTTNTAANEANNLVRQQSVIVNEEVALSQTSVGASAGAAAGPMLAFGAAALMVGGAIGIAAAGIGLAAMGVSMLVDSIKGLADDAVVDNLWKVGSGLFYIAQGLGAVTLAGLAAGPAIAAVGILAATGANININKNEGGEENSQLGLILKELQDIKIEISKGGTVNMDGKKVGDALRLYGIQTVKIE